MQFFVTPSCVITTFAVADPSYVTTSRRDDVDGDSPSSVTVACIVADLVVYFAHPVKGFPLPRSIAVLDWLLLLAFVAGTRLIARSLRLR